MKRIFSEMKSLRYALLAFAASALLLGGCSGGGGSDYEAPEVNQTPDDSAYIGPQLTTTQPLAGHTQNVLIDATIIKNWIDQGLVNRPLGSERVVLLSVSDTAKYAAGHIPGAQLWATGEHVMNRIEGPVETVNMVLTGAAMDEMLQKHAIDGTTTIVLTAHTGQATYQVGRAYFLLRYWGFPKDRIKILDGFDSAWTDAGFALTADAPAVSRSDFSVCELPQFRDDLRGGLSEVIAAIENQTMQVVDFRGDAMPAATAGVFADDRDGDGTAEADFVVFEGTMKGGKYYSWSKLVNPDRVTGTADDKRFVTPDVLTAEFAAAGIDNSKKLITMCRTAMIASAGFLAVDAILGWDAMVYDGSWSQWGSLSDQTAKGGLLPAGSIWATDVAELMDVVLYNADAGKLVEPARVAIPDAASPYDAGANNIEIEDREYFEAAPTGPASSTGGGGGGGC
ncbi:selenite/tellurite reduction operon rhodanese-like protein ExtH [Trichloromonas sp.]|uniref:selenite/tellurite reduction operon rhodanese-like protein ExtH n=1 Tax=Trichloromonas sp. TaxID=3069249 RepID=UPI002A4B9BA8|nr:selenite/tellurite reduction operon rhodanese-like protein ExtH [Trichloromonas sp.]